MTSDITTGSHADDDFVERLFTRLESQASDAEPVDAADDPVVEAVADQLRSAAMWSGPPPGLRDSILSQVRATAAAASAPAPASTRAAEPAVPPVSGRAPTPTPTPMPAPWRPAPDRARPSWWPFGRQGGPVRLRWAVPVAAFGAAAFTAGVLAVDRALEPDPKPRDVYAVAGTSLAPGAKLTASVAETGGGFSIWVRTTGLPPAAQGSYYAAWLTGPRGTVPLGSFHERQAGDRIELWSGVDPEGYPTLLITLQAEGGPPGPSTLVVATGPLER